MVWLCFEVARETSIYTFLRLCNIVHVQLRQPHPENHDPWLDRVMKIIDEADKKFQIGQHEIRLPVTQPG